MTITNAELLHSADAPASGALEYRTAAGRVLVGMVEWATVGGKRRYVGRLRGFKARGMKGKRALFGTISGADSWVREELSLRLGREADTLNVNVVGGAR